MKEILNIIHNTIYQFFDVCNDGEEVPMSDRDKLLLEVNKAICNNLKALEQQPILDKIKAEILDEAEYAYADFERYKEDILHAEPDELPDDDFRYGLERAVEIIDKYKS